MLSASDNQMKWLLDSLIVLVTRLGALPDPLLAPVQPYINSPSPIIRQLAIELTNFSKLPNITAVFNANTDVSIIPYSRLIINIPDKSRDQSLEVALYKCLISYTLETLVLFMLYDEE